MITLYNDDAIKILPTLASGSVDGIITDPPYCCGGASPVSRSNKINNKIQDSTSKVKYPPLIGVSRDQRSQLAWMTLWLAECWRAAKKDGILLLFTDWRQLPLFTDAVQAAGWTWRSLVVWDKTIATRPNKGFFRHQAEYIIFATKDAWVAPTCECMPGVFGIPVNAVEKNHLTAKPVNLIIELMKILAPDALVLDPFMGGGAVPRACKLTGRRCIGIELQPESYKTAMEFMTQESGKLFNQVIGA
jgi:site-specific DNA-methyltransferase (adenine-specific)